MADLKYMPMDNSRIEPGWYVAAPRGAQMVRYTGDATTQGVTQYDLIPGIMAWAAPRDEVIRGLVEALEALDVGQSVIPDHWEYRCMARKTAATALAAARKLGVG